jgi:ribonuclease T1
VPRLGKRATQVASTVLTLVLLVAVWWLQSQDQDDSGRQADDRTSASSTPSSGATSSESDAPAGERDDQGVPYVDLADLPPEAAETVALIDAGGPFPYPGKDGSTFGNFEGVLPDRDRGYYAEYTVETPGLDHRGARRIIAGDEGELYWTADHYESFERIRR